jgi:hypothetical protein
MTINIILIACLLISSQMQASLWCANNNAGTNANLPELQSAHNTAVAGDRIHIETSATIYCGVNCSKPLVWLVKAIS